MGSVNYNMYRSIISLMFLAVSKWYLIHITFFITSLTTIAKMGKSTVKEKEAMGKPLTNHKLLGNFSEVPDTASKQYIRPLSHRGGPVDYLYYTMVFTIC